MTERLDGLSAASIIGLAELDKRRIEVLAPKMRELQKELNELWTLRLPTSQMKGFHWVEGSPITAII